MSASHADQLLPGNRLRKAREACGLSQDDVARRLHMSVTFVRAIESDDYERLPESAFIKGYMRNYARLVGVPADEVANLYQQMVDEERADGSVNESMAQSAGGDRGGRLRHWLVVAAITAVLLSGWWLSGSDGDVEPPAALTSEALPDASVQSSSLGADARELEESGDQAPEAMVNDMQAPLVDEGTQESVQPVDALVTLDNLVITFSADCWLEVLDASGEAVFSGQRNPDRPLSLQGLGPFRITFGDGSAVASLSVNGAGVNIPSAAPGNVVRVTAP